MRVSPLPITIKPLDEGGAWGREWSRQIANIQGALEGSWDVVEQTTADGLRVIVRNQASNAVVYAYKAGSYSGGETISISGGCLPQNIVLLSSDGGVVACVFDGSTLNIPNGSYTNASISGTLIKGV